MNSIDDIRATYKDPQAKPESLEAAAAAARRLAAEAETALASLIEGRPGVALSGSDVDLERHDGRERHAGRMIERSKALSEACEARAAELRRQSAEAGRIERYEAELKRMDALQSEIEPLYNEGVRIFRSMMELIAKRDLERDAINRDLPQGRAPLPPADDFRRVPDIRSKMINLRSIDLWVMKGINR